MIETKLLKERLYANTRQGVINFFKLKNKNDIDCYVKIIDNIIYNLFKNIVDSSKENVAIPCFEDNKQAKLIEWKYTSYYFISSICDALLINIFNNNSEINIKDKILKNIDWNSFKISDNSSMKVKYNGQYIFLEYGALIDRGIKYSFKFKNSIIEGIWHPYKDKKYLRKLN